MILENYKMCHLYTGLYKNKQKQLVYITGTLLGEIKTPE